jgi:hypothetical protein
MPALAPSTPPSSSKDCTRLGFSIATPNDLNLTGDLRMARGCVARF